MGFFTKEIEGSELLEQRGQRRRREDEGIEPNQKDENEGELEQIVDRIFADANSDARSNSPAGSRRAAAKSRWREP